MTKFTYTQLKKLPVFIKAHKMYYKKYPFCVRFKAIDFFQSDGFAEHARNAREIKSFLTRHDVNHRSRLDYHLAIYLLDLDSVFLLYNKLKDDIVSIEGPLNETHYNVLNDDLNVVVRDKLFYNKYRYKISSKFVHTESDQLNGLIDTCNSFEKDSYKFNKVIDSYIKNKMLDEATNKNYVSSRSLYRSRYRYMNYIETATIYLTDYDDVCTLHFMFKNIISSTVKIVLTDEVK